MYQRSKRRSLKFTSHELRTPAFESLNIEESQKRSRLIEQVGNAFYLSGIALLQLKEERLYRSTHLSFDEFCQDIFSYSSDYAYLKIAAAKVYQNLRDNLPQSEGQPTIGRCFPLPTRQRQLRPIVKAKLDKDAQVEVWVSASALADGKIPSSSLVAEAVRAYLAKNNTQVNPFQKGDVCRIVVRGNNQLKGQGGSWCIVESVSDCHCLVNTWNDQLSVPIDNLESKNLNNEEYRAIEDIGVRMSKLHETGKLDEAALWILNGLAKLDRAELTSLEDKLLRVLEEFYIPHDVE